MAYAQYSAEQMLAIAKRIEEAAQFAALTVLRDAQLQPTITLTYPDAAWVEEQERVKGAFDELKQRIAADVGREASNGAITALLGRKEL
jgi:hypothetical protein